MEDYLDNFKKKKHKSSKAKININYKSFLSKLLLSVIFFLVSIIYTNYSDKNLLFYKEHVLTESMEFMKVKGWYEKLFGKVLPKQDNIQSVFDNKLVYKEINDYLDGEALLLSNSALVNNMQSGIVVFVGEKDGYNNTVIVQGVDGTDIWYGNLTNVSVNLYDYLDLYSVIGEVNGDTLYLVIKKDQEFIKYEDYKV